MRLIHSNESRAVPVNRSSRRVLVIDDSVDTALSMALLLRQMGHEADYVTSGRDGLHVARRTQPDVVLLDLGLPDIDGYSVVRHMRRDPRLRTVRVVAITGKAADDDRARSLSLGFDEHCAKPVGPERLEAILG
jgi:CheY-like chemotaxis protein